MAQLNSKWKSIELWHGFFHLIDHLGTLMEGKEIPKSLARQNTEGLFQSSKCDRKNNNSEPVKGLEKTEQMDLNIHFNLMQPLKKIAVNSEF